MRRTHMLQGIGSFIGMLILILDANTALQGAQSGLDLCIQTIIPSLFPFFVLSHQLTSSLSGSAPAFLQPLGKLFGIPTGAEGILISGFLGGYPVGAQCIASLYHGKQLSKADAERMLAFCSNAGPAFLFGMVAPLFSSAAAAWILWCIHILGAFLTALTFPKSSENIILDTSHPNAPASSASLRSAVNALVNVCSWVILFRILITFLQRWCLWLFPMEFQTILFGILELSNGCLELSILSDSRFRFLLASGFLSFGGLCVTMQTISVTSGLSLRQYFRGKLFQTVFSLSAAYALSFDNALPLGLFLVFLLFGGRKIRKSSSNHCFFGV